MLARTHCMEMPLGQQRGVVLRGLIGVVAALFCIGQASAYERYNSGCQNCHGSFLGNVSPKGTVFPGNSKHTMHRSSSYMATACNLCHKTGDNYNPYIGQSNGTTHNPGLGCSGCHGNDYGGTIGVSGAGLRAHHASNGVTVCAGCHTSDPVPMPEYINPTYYGTVDTHASDSCNTPPGSNSKENFSIGDTLGLDNDGNSLYDAADPACTRTLGDLNCDGIINFDDINPFVMALSDPDGYHATYPNCNIYNGDVNSDGAVNFDDINPFIALLSGGA